MDEKNPHNDPNFLNWIGFLTSLILHTLVLLILALWNISLESVGRGGIAITMEMTDVPLEELDDFQEEDSVTLETSPETTDARENLLEEVEEVPVSPTVLTPDLHDLAPETEDHPEGEEPLHEYDEEVYRTGEAWEPQAAVLPETAGYEGRTNAEVRSRLLKDGASIDSEAAVRRGLQWIVAHQQADRSQKKTWGCWSFDLSKAPFCNCTHPGDQTSTTGATALALLAMLGHGNTREQGEFRQSVKEGLYYLSTRAIRRKGIPGLDLREGTMYAQALSALAICEAHAMEGRKDPGLDALAHGVVEWILWAQDPHSGGWRYEPREAGDVTVTTWMIMVLKSARMAGIEIPSTTLVGIERFLNSVASEENVRYSYQVGDNPIRSTTAIGLFARMFTGARQNERYLKLGTDLIGDWGYSGSDLYYNYYATLLLRHYGGVQWERWNPAMRDYLIATQSYQGHESGSWYFNEPDKSHNLTGGRLYTTAMATMILEVYYRYMPIYQPIGDGLRP
ncbi:MAG: hypothetical protein Q4D62_05610 [Planctomycetia bacterium]|nr:hypothetical protein [Planctomycetia bacterium]